MISIDTANTNILDRMGEAGLQRGYTFPLTPHLLRRLSRVSVPSFQTTPLGFVQWYGFPKQSKFLPATTTCTKGIHAQQTTPSFSTATLRLNARATRSYTKYLQTPQSLTQAAALSLTQSKSQRHIWAVKSEIGYRSICAGEGRC